MSKILKKALILGVTGQDGSYLAEFLIKKNYEVHGLIRKSATGNTANISHLINNKKFFNKNFFLHRGDLSDITSLYRIISEVRPKEIYNEADQDHVRWSFDMVDYSSNITAAAVANILEVIKQIDPKIRYFQPCTSNMFGITKTKLQDENTPFNPQSPYAVSKTFAYYTTRYYRQAFGLHASNAILYNHESPRRTPEYVSRKITQSVAKIASGEMDKLVMGDLSARIDWGYAGEYMEVAWKILQQDKPNDYVVATGEAHSVQDFVNIAFSYVGLNPTNYVTTDKSFLRQTKTSTLIGNINKASEILGFKPKIRLKQLVEMMVENDIKLLNK